MGLTRPLDRLDFEELYHHNLDCICPWRGSKSCYPCATLVCKQAPCLLPEHSFGPFAQETEIDKEKLEVM